jgi:hypothetical protein
MTHGGLPTSFQHPICLHGASENSSFWGKGELRVVRIALDGYPGDCMLLAFTGIMKEDRPDPETDGESLMALKSKLE